jgi:hypothetical protein
MLRWHLRQLQNFSIYIASVFLVIAYFLQYNITFWKILFALGHIRFLFISPIKYTSEFKYFNMHIKSSDLFP